MEQYRIEIQNVGRGLVMLTCPAKAPLMLTAADSGREQSEEEQPAHARMLAR